MLGITAEREIGGKYERERMKERERDIMRGMGGKEIIAVLLLLLLQQPWLTMIAVIAGFAGFAGFAG